MQGTGEGWGWILIVSVRKWTEGENKGQVFWELVKSNEDREQHQANDQQKVPPTTAALHSVRLLSSQGMKTLHSRVAPFILHFRHIHFHTKQLFILIFVMLVFTFFSCLCLRHWGWKLVDGLWTHGILNHWLTCKYSVVPHRTVVDVLFIKSRLMIFCIVSVAVSEYYN